MFWGILWALILGFAIAAAVQAVVSRSEMRRLLPGDSPRSLGIGCGLGAASSSPWCSYFARRRCEAMTLVGERPGGGLVEVGSRSFAEGCASEPAAYIEGWYVEPDARRQWVGTALIRAAEQWAFSAGFRELGSDAELSNRVSRAAHRALGFMEVVQIACFRRVLDDSA